MLLAVPEKSKQKLFREGFLLEVTFYVLKLIWNLYLKDYYGVNLTFKIGMGEEMKKIKAMDKISELIHMFLGMMCKYPKNINVMIQINTLPILIQ